MKFTSIFFTASESIFAIYCKDTNKRAINMKFTSIFFTANESIFAIYCKDTKISLNMQKFRADFSGGEVHDGLAVQLERLL